MLFSKDKYYAIILKKVNNAYVKVAKKKISPLKGAVEYKGKALPIDFNNVLYRDGAKSYIFVDADSLESVSPQKGLSAPTAAVVDSIVSRSIISQLVSRASPSATNMQWLLLLMGILMGAAFGYIFGSYMPITQAGGA